MVSWLVPWRLGGLRSLTFAQCRANSCFASPRRDRVTRLICESVINTVCVYVARLMLALRHSPNTNISRAQNGSTGQKPWNTKNKANPSENRHVEAKKSMAPAGLSEQFGAS